MWMTMRAFVNWRALGITAMAPQTAPRVVGLLEAM